MFWPVAAWQQVKAFLKSFCYHCPMNSSPASTLHIAVASRNPVKIAACRQAFEAVFPHHQLRVEGFSVPSGVSDQPLTDAETFEGARNRVHALPPLAAEADFFVGIEGGIDRHGRSVQAFAWILVMDAEGLQGTARTAAFSLPPAVVQLLEQGLELGHANDEVFGREHSKHKEGAVGLLTNGLIDRCGLYAHAVQLACIPFIQREMFAPKAD